MDLLALAAGVTAATGLATGLCSRRRANRMEAEASKLLRELEAVRHAAIHDPLTGVLNRRAFYQLGAALVASPLPVVGVFVDLDEFKEINDRLGHAAGDEVLVTVASRLLHYAGDDLVARLGGDEFAMLLTAPITKWRWLPLAVDKLAQVLAEPIRIDGVTVSVTASIGLVPVQGPADLPELIRRADIAMYQAKRTKGRASIAPPMPGSIPDDSRARSNPPDLSQVSGPTTSRSAVRSRGATAEPRVLVHATSCSRGKHEYADN